MNKIIIIGNLTGDPVTRAIPNTNNEVCTFRVAVNEKRGENEITTFFDCSAWDKKGSICQKFLAKGAKVLVEGKANTKPYIGKDGKAYGNVIISVSNVEFLTRKQETPEVQAKMDEMADIDPADIPF